MGAVRAIDAGTVSIAELARMIQGADLSALSVPEKTTRPSKRELSKRFIRDAMKE